LKDAFNCVCQNQQTADRRSLISGFYSQMIALLSGKFEKARGSFACKPSRGAPFKPVD
jgi:hypothetical protein